MESFENESFTAWGPLVEDGAPYYAIGEVEHCILLDAV